MPNIAKINTWQMISEDQRLVWITYDYDHALLGVTELPSKPNEGTWDTNLDVMVWDRTQPHARICD
jgi:hypothetical protein